MVSLLYEGSSVNESSHLGNNLIYQLYNLLYFCVYKKAMSHEWGVCCQILTSSFLFNWRNQFSTKAKHANTATFLTCVKFLGTSLTVAAPAQYSSEQNRNRITYIL